MQNMVRKGLYGEVDWTDKDDMTGISHLDHCIDIIRQNLQCNADVTPLTWIRDPVDGRAKEVAEVIHTCRDWDRLQEWALEHKVWHKWDAYELVTDDPLGWGGYSLDHTR